ncbi:Ferm domain-containing protein 8 [Plakobranchus ocellatus]|uniref:Ferm domain-containing protein 8 n=1 Tax=Plakobranchus ocellatus TaxID=259542 RepID=A0AAV3ZXC9_9GAST|nr:Ferm domain-containing protein 8 [Plakobranchus ocellatus]
MYARPRFSFLRRSGPPVTPVEDLFMDAHRRASEELAHIASKETLGQLYRKYLELLWTYPFYGGAFFSGVLEGKTNRFRRFILPNPDIRVSLCINTEGVCIFNRAKAELLLYVPFTQLSWTWQDLPWDGDSDPPPTLMLQFLCDEQVEDNPGKPVTKLLQVYSREARLMDALIESSVSRKLERMTSNADADFVDGGVSESSERKILNKLEKLTLETYTQDGEQLESA